jgi:hypothetical protein
MAKRAAQARSEEIREGMPPTLGSAAEEHAQALRLELLKSTELAQTILSEGEKRPVPQTTDGPELRLVESPAEGPPNPQQIARHSGRERLYADIGGAVIGLGVAAALLNFVILK